MSGWRNAHPARTATCPLCKGGTAPGGSTPLCGSCYRSKAGRWWLRTNGPAKPATQQGHRRR